MIKIGFDGKRAVQNFTGLGNYSRYVIDALQTYYPEEHYYIYAPRERENPQLTELLKKGKGSISMHYPTSALWKKLRSLWRIKGIRKDLEKDKIDIYHGLSNGLPLNIKKIQGVKSVVTIHDLIFLRLPNCYPPIDRKIYAYKARKACLNANHIIAVSECTKRDIIHYYGVSADKISVIYQGCNPIFSHNPMEEELKRVRLSRNLPQKYILFVGSIEERKNALTILESMVYLPGDIHLVLVGKHTPYTDKIVARAKQLGLESRLHIYHNIPFADLPAIYQMALTFVYPSVYEGFGIPILEALNSSVPVVAATGSCLEEAGGPASLYVSPYDAKALAEAVKKTLWPEARKIMIEKGLEWASHFTLKQMADQTMECYKNILKR